MKLSGLSDASLKKLEKLRQSRGFVSKFLGRYDTETDILLDLADSGEVALIPSLADYALGAELKQRRSAEFAISKLLEALPIDRLMDFEMLSRSWFESWTRAEDAWSSLTPDRFHRLLGASSFGLLAFASMHPNGRVREVVVRSLSGFTDGRELAFLLARANDWVEPIRRLAREAIEARLNSVYVSEFLRCLPLILQLQQCRRASHHWMPEALEKLLNRDECLSVLQSELRSPDVLTRRFCLRCLGGESSRLQPELMIALEDSDPWNRLLAAQKLMAIKDELIFSLVWKMLRDDPFMPLRREALYARNQVVDGELRSDLIGALLDRHHAVRSAARFFLGKEFDAVSWYREALRENQGAQLSAAIQGLGECGIDADADLLVGFLHSSELRIRKAAIVSIGRLAAKRYVDLLKVSLLDPSPGVSKMAKLALLHVASLVDSRWVEAQLRENAYFHVQKNMLSLAERISKWERITLMLLACRSSDKEIADLALIGVRRWMCRANSGSIKSNKEQIIRARTELEMSREKFDPHTYRLLEFTIRD